jgi:hypothetical protein
MRRHTSSIFSGRGYVLGCVLLLLCAMSSAMLAQASSPGGDNMLRNATFDERAGRVPAGWVPSVTGGSTAGWTDQACQGDGAGYIKKIKDGRSHVSALAQDVQAQPNARYTLSGFAYAAWQSGGQAKLFAYEYDVQGKWLGNTKAALAPVRPDQTYMPIHVQFVTRPTTAWLQVRYEIYGENAEGEAYIDNLYLGTRTQPPAPVTEVQVRQDEGYRISWTASPPNEARHFNVYRGSSPGFVTDHHTLLGTTGKTEWLDVDDPETTTDDTSSLLYGVSPPRYYAVVAMDDALNTSVPAHSSRAGAATAPIVGWAEGSWKLRQDEWPTQVRRAPVRIQAARHEYEPFHRWSAADRCRACAGTRSTLHVHPIG